MHKLFVFLLCFSFPCFLSAQSESTAVRSISGNNTATVSISVEATPATSVTVYAVEDSIPDGLTPANITEGGSFDTVNKKVKWGPFFDNMARTLAYEVSGTDGSYTLSGVGSFDGASVPTTGASEATIEETIDPKSKLERSFTNNNTATVTVTVSTNPDPSVSSYAVEENIPEALTPVNITEGGTFDTENRKVKWGPFFDTTARTLAYDVSGTAGSYTLTGSGSFDGANVSTTGEGELAIAEVADPKLTLERSLTNNNTGTVTVTVSVTPDPSVSSYAVEENIPEALTPANITEGGTFDTANRKVKWGPFLDATARTLAYDVSGTAGSYTLTGSGSFDGTNVSTTGEGQVTIAVVAAPESKVERSFANNNTATVTVTVSTSSDPSVSSYAVEENILEALTPANITEGGTFDTENRKVKWGPFLDATARTLAYDVSGTAGSYTLTGSGSFDGANVSTTGEGQVTIAVVAAPESKVERSFAGNNTAKVTLTVVAAPSASVSSYAIEENIPEGLTPENITEGGSFDTVNRKVKWGPFFDTTTRTLTYDVSGADGNYTLGGVGSFDGTSIDTIGEAQIIIDNSQEPKSNVVLLRTKLAKGWNFLSVPVTPNNKDLNSFFMDKKAGHLWRYHGGFFEIATSLSAGAGFWVYMREALTVFYTGEPKKVSASGLVPGWNIIAPIGETAIPENAMGTVWTNENGRFVTVQGSLLPGKNYWVNLESIENVDLGSVAAVGDNAIPDFWEIIWGLTGTDSANDDDNDNLSTLEEFENATNPFDPDTDGDGVRDDLEVEVGSEPSDSN